MFTIGMMVKNEEEYLRFCLDNMALKNVSFTVIDTGSTDGTKSILKSKNIRYADVPFKNYADTRNVIFDLSQSEFVLMLDGDETITDKVLSCDYIHKGYLFNRCHYLGNGCLYFDLTLRLIKNELQHRYHNNIFEGICLEEPDKQVLHHTIHHFGYLKKSFGQKMKKNIEIIEDELRKNDRSVLYSMLALYLILLNNLDASLEVINEGSRKYENVWFYILKSDIYKAKKQYDNSMSILNEAVDFCRIKQTSCIKEFYMSRIFNKMAIVHMCGNKYDEALMNLSEVHSFLEYCRLINQKYIYEKTGNSKELGLIDKKLERFPFENQRKKNRTDPFMVHVLSDTFNELLMV